MPLLNEINHSLTELLKRQSGTSSQPYCDGYACYSFPVYTIIGIIVGILVFFGILLIVFCVWRHKRRERLERQQDEREAAEMDAWAASQQALYAQHKEPVTTHVHSLAPQQTYWHGNVAHSTAAAATVVGVPPPPPPVGYVHDPSGGYPAAPPPYQY
jgi:hypothetical protein